MFIFKIFLVYFNNYLMLMLKLSLYFDEFDYRNYFKQFVNSSAYSTSKLNEDQAEQILKINKNMSKNNQNLPKQLLQFIARQLTILKDIAQTIPNTHPDITMQRLKESIVLIEKKIIFTAGSNPEQYHDYIQDFYENQIEVLRKQLNMQKMALKNKNKQCQDIKVINKMLTKQKENYVMSNAGETSRILKGSYDAIGNFQESVRYKQELDHCRVLLDQNTAFIEQQAKAIELLLAQSKTKDKQMKQQRDAHEQKVLQFDTFINKTQQQTDTIIKSLANDQKQYQYQLKQLSLVKIRVIQQRSTLQKQLEMKLEEIQLLTKKILEDQIIIGKLEKTVVLKEKLIDELYVEIDSVNGSLSRIGKKEGDFQKINNQKNEEIIKLEDRIRVINQVNQKCQKKINYLNKKVEDLQRQNSKLQKQISQKDAQFNKLEDDLQKSHKQLEQIQKSHSKLTKQKQKYQTQVKLMEQRYQELYQRNKEEKQLVKKEIMTEVNELIGLVQQKDSQIKLLSNQKEELEKELKIEKQGKSEVQNNFEKMNGIVEEIQSKIDYLQNQNGQLSQTKGILELEIQRMRNQMTKLCKFEYQYAKITEENKNLMEQIQLLKKSENQTINSQTSMNLALEKKQNEKEQLFKEERKQSKQLINKKQFQVKQLESRVKVLQDQLKNTTKLFDNEKLKMSVKIKQLEELLKERYEFSGRFSHQSDY